MKNYIFVVGQIKGDSWELGGVYTNIELAIENCIDENDFVGVVELDETATKETSQYILACYPELETPEYLSEFIEQVNNL
jgi:hypothetical protein